MDGYDLPPELIQALADAGMLDDKQDLLKQMMVQALRDKNAQQPGITETRGMAVLPSITGNIAATLKQIKGSQDEKGLQQQYAQLLQQYANTAGKKYAFDAAQRKAAVQPEPPPTIPSWPQEQ